MQSDSNLRETLRSIDHKSYPAYKSLRGSYRFADYVLSIDHVQGDSFAAPSALCLKNSRMSTSSTLTLTLI